MWKKLKSRGAETVEYAIVLACIAAFGLMFSDNLTHTLKTLMGKTNSIITNGTTDKDDNDKNDHNVAINDRNMAWLKETFLNTAITRADDIEKYLDKNPGKNNKPNFKDNNGIIDSDSNSKFLEKIGLTNGGGLENSSWAFVGYKNDQGELCYGVSIYSKEKNSGQSLADKQVGDTIITDIYTVNKVTGNVELYQKNATQKVGKNTNGKNQVIRDP